MSNVSNEVQQPERRLGKAPAKSNLKALMLSNYLKKKAVVPAPLVYDFWKGRKPFPIRDVGNNENGSCTKSSQVILSQRMERLEQRKTVLIDKQEIIDSYYRMTERLYGGGDTGAYETDALDEWRNPDRTFRDIKGRPVTIDAYVRINHFDVEEVKRALWLAGARGIKVCFSLPLAWAQRTDNIWDIPNGQQPIGDYMPGSWGGHSCAAVSSWNESYLTVPSTWNNPDYKVSWRAMAVFSDEAHLCIDSINSWKKIKSISSKLDLTAIKADVNKVSNIQI